MHKRLLLPVLSRLLLLHRPGSLRCQVAQLVTCAELLVNALGHKGALDRVVSAALHVIGDRALSTRFDLVVLTHLANADRRRWQFWRRPARLIALRGQIKLLGWALIIGISRLVGAGPVAREQRARRSGDLRQLLSLGGSVPWQVMVSLDTVLCRSFCDRAPSRNWRI